VTYEEKVSAMMPYYRVKPLGVPSNPDVNRAAARMLRPFREMTDLKLPFAMSQTTVVSHEDKGVRAPLWEGRNASPDAAALVPQAAAILDEEMAAGMRAAYEARPLDSNPWKPYDSASAAVSEKWLQDLNNLVDALGDVLPRVQDYLTTALDKSAEVAGSPECESVSVLRPRASVRAGECAKISMRLNNDDVHAAHVVLFCTDLFSTSGGRIPQQHVSPIPNQLELQPDTYADVVLQIDVPSVIRPGSYSGLLMASGLCYLRAVIAVEVV
jgi:hypothetical protein